MAYWLFKSEPGTWSWQDQLAKGDEGEGWDGVRNHQAGNNMKAMQIGDLGFFYHSVNEVPDPRGTTGTSRSQHIFTIFATSSVERGKTATIGGHL